MKSQNTSHAVLLAQISLTLLLFVYHSSLPVGLLYYIPCPHWTVIDKFSLVDQHLHVCMKGSIKHCLWIRPYFSSSVRHILTLTQTKKHHTHTHTFLVTKVSKPWILVIRYTKLYLFQIWYCKTRKINVSKPNYPNFVPECQKSVTTLCFT